MIFITFESRDKTCSKIEKPWFLLVQWVAKCVKMSGKMIFLLIWVIIDHRFQQFSYIRHDQWLILLYHFHQKIIQKKLEMFKKRNSSGHTLDFMPPRRPGLYISRVDFFVFEYREFPVECINTFINCSIVIRSSFSYDYDCRR